MEPIKQYFGLQPSLKKGVAVACTRGKTPVAHDLIPEVKGKIKLPFDLILKKITSKNGELVYDNDVTGLNCLWQDYQANCLAWPIMSKKMKEIIEHHLTGKEGIVWVTVLVIQSTDTREYFIPFFKKRLDVINKQKTMFLEGTNYIIVPVFSLEKISNYSLFHSGERPWEVTSDLFISKELKKDLQRAKLSGVGFGKANVA